MRLILNDGTVIEGGHAGLAESYLWLWLPGMTMQGAVDIVFNPRKMEVIVYQFGDEETTFYGFTECENIAKQDSEIMVCMVKG